MTICVTMLAGCSSLGTDEDGPADLVQGFRAVVEYSHPTSGTYLRHMELSGPEWIRYADFDLRPAYHFYEGHNPPPKPGQGYAVADMVYWLDGGLEVHRSDNPCATAIGSANERRPDCEFYSVYWHREATLPPEGVYWPKILQSDPDRVEWYIAPYRGTYEINWEEQGSRFVVEFELATMVYESNRVLPELVKWGNWTRQTVSFDQFGRYERIDRSPDGDYFTGLPRQSLFPDAHESHLSQAVSTQQAFERLKHHDEAYDILNSGGCVVSVSWSNTEAPWPFQIPLDPTFVGYDIFDFDIIDTRGNGSTWTVSHENGVLQVVNEEWTVSKGRSISRGFDCHEMESVPWPKNGMTEGLDRLLSVYVSHNREWGVVSGEWKMTGMWGEDDYKIKDQYGVSYAPKSTEDQSGLVISYTPYRVNIWADDLSLHWVLFHPEDRLILDAQ